MASDRNKQCVNKMFPSIYVNAILEAHRKDNLYLLVEEMMRWKNIIYDECSQSKHWLGSNKLHELINVFGYE